MNRDSSSLRDGSKIGPHWRENLFLRLAIWFSYLPRSLTSRVWSFGDALRHIQDQRKIFGRQAPLVQRREEIWDLVMRQIREHRFLAPETPLRDQSVVLLEFGVAWGYSTDYFLRHLNGVDYEYHGFDTFRGLNLPFREFEAGAFDNDGQPPNIADSRLVWHIGDVAETLREDNARSLMAVSKRIICLLDLDLFKPTTHVLRVVTPYLKKGDILYFDEPIDMNEAVPLQQLLAGEFGPLHFRCLAYSPISLALEVI